MYNGLNNGMYNGHEWNNTASETIITSSSLKVRITSMKSLDTITC